MMEPTPQPPAPDAGPTWLSSVIATLNAYRPIIRDFVVAFGVFATLGTSIYTSCQASKHTATLNDVRSQQDVAVQAAQKTKAVADDTLVTVTGDPKAPQKAIQAATTQAGQ